MHYVFTCNNKSFPLSTKRFPRWERGSCVEAKPVQVPGQDEPCVFSFFTDVSRHPSILELAQGIQETVRSGIGELFRLANWWKKYRSLWKMQRVSLSIYNNLFICLSAHTLYDTSYLVVHCTLCVFCIGHPTGKILSETSLVYGL